MKPSFEANQLVALPRLNARAALVLVGQLIDTAVASNRPPAAAQEDIDALKAARDKLDRLLREKPGHAVDTSTTAQVADFDEDNAWTAMFEWLAGWAKLPNEYAGAWDARSLIDRIYPNGLEFIRIPYRLEWAEAETRLGIIADQHLDELIENLGGKPFLSNLQKVHEHYGRVLGIPSAQVPEETEAIREALADAVEALRTYVLRVAASVRKTDPKSGELAAVLLSPLAEWPAAASSSDGRYIEDPTTVDDPTVDDTQVITMIVSQDK